MLQPTLKKVRHDPKRLPTAPSPTIPPSQSPDKTGPLDAEQLRKINAYWRAANYLSVARSISVKTPCFESR